MLLHSSLFTSRLLLALYLRNMSYSDAPPPARLAVRSAQQQLAFADYPASAASTSDAVTIAPVTSQLWFILLVSFSAAFLLGLLIFMVRFSAALLILLLYTYTCSLARVNSQKQRCKYCNCL